MTFCLAVKVQEGLVGIADTRITSGAECITARKVSVHTHGQHSLFLMTSGLRSVRDKVVTYFEEALESNTGEYDRLYKAVNALAALSKMDKEDKLFSRDIVAVDMRLPDRLIVQLSEDAAKAREELFKDKKKKAGSA